MNTYALYPIYSKWECDYLYIDHDTERSNDKHSCLIAKDKHCKDYECDFNQYNKSCKYRT